MVQTAGAVTSNDAGSGPTKGAQTEHRLDREQFQRLHGQQRWRDPRSEIDRRVTARNRCHSGKEAVTASVFGARRVKRLNATDGDAEGAKTAHA